MGSKKLLIIDGNKRHTNDAQQALGGKGTGAGYAAVLRQLEPALECTVVTPAYEDYQSGRIALRDFHGAVITGSALHVYDSEPAVRNQLELVTEVFEAGVPVFGSCWGLQLANVVLGGRVAANPRGKEVGIARCIYKTAAGGEHPMLVGKAPVFNAIAIHTDIVTELPSGSTLLASNDNSDVQAVEIVQGDKCFWGVQYHPEFSLFDMAAIYQRHHDTLLADGFVESSQALQTLVNDYLSLDRNPRQLNLNWRYGFDQWVLDFDARTLELRNWLAYLAKQGTALALSV